MTHHQDRRRLNSALYVPCSPVQRARVVICVRFLVDVIDVMVVVLIGHYRCCTIHVAILVIFCNWRCTLYNASICDWKNKFSLFGKYHLFRIESFRVDFRCVHRLQLLKVCNQYVTFPNSTQVQSVSEEQSKKDFLSKLMES